MTSKSFIPVTLALAAIVWLTWQGSMVSSAAAGDAPVVTAATLAVSATATVGGEPEYVGSNKCKMCHMKQSKSWKQSKKYHALDTLKPGNASDVKAKHGLDAGKDYSTDAACVKCHVTGFEQPGGYAFHDGSDEKVAKKMDKLANVGCEMCHGPGSEYVALHTELLKTKRKYKVEEMYAAGMTKLDASVCTKCHNAESPTIDADVPFDFEAMKEKGAHEHFELKQREE